MKNSVSRTQAEKAYKHTPQADNLPLAIGANFHDDPLNRSTLRKSNNLLLDRKTDYAPHSEYPNASTARARSQAAKSSAQDDETDDAVWDGWLNETITPEEERDFTVRCLGYYIDNIPEGTAEDERIHMVCIKYFVQDNSVSILEAKKGNREVIQGEIVSRRQIPKSLANPQDLLLLDDFQIGKAVVVYGRTYYILDVDKRSRKYLTECRGQVVPEPVPVPVHEGTATAQEKAAASTFRGYTADDMDRKRVAEQQLTGIYTKHSTEDIQITQQFLKNAINEHLTYLALWDDRGSLHGDLRYCVIRLFLENCSAEVVEQRGENSGRFGSAVLISRQRIPRSGTELSSSRYQEHTYGKLMKNNYLSAEDFQVGETYQIFGKSFFVYDANDFTRNYVRENFGLELKQKVNIAPFEDESKKSAVFYPPPPNGFGSEREQRANWLSLSAKPDTLSLGKAQQDTGRVMNFSARMAKPLVKGDEEREFVITFYCDTAEVEINEKARRNSGFQAGRFLAKGKHRKTLPNGTTAPFASSDFVAGEEITIFDRPFILLAADEGTKRILAGLDATTTEDHIRNLVELVKRQINLKFKKANEAYLALAPGGTLGYRQIKEFLRSCSCTISDSDAMLVTQNLCPESDGMITYENFQRIFSLSAESLDVPSCTTGSKHNVNMTVSSSMAKTTCVSEDMQLRRKLKEVLRQKLLQRSGSLHETFRALGNHSLYSRMTQEAFRRSLVSILDLHVGKKEEDLLVDIVFDGVSDDDDGMTFKQFQSMIDSM